MTDLEVCFLSITSAIIILLLPRRILRAFALTSLGHLSAIYRNGLEESFDVRRECADIAVRLMSHSLTFSRLTDKAAPNIIKQEQMFNQLKYILQNHEHEIDSDELHRMVSFCFSTAALNKSFTGALDEIRSTLRRIPSCMNLLRGSGDELETSRASKAFCYDRMSIDSYMVAATSNEKINFDNMRRLFDKDRYIFCVESWFTPSELKRAIHEEQSMPVPTTSRVPQEEFSSVSDIAHQAKGPAEQAESAAESMTSTADLVAAPLPAEFETLQQQVAELRRSVAEAQQAQAQAASIAARAERAVEAAQAEAAAAAAAEVERAAAMAGHRGGSETLEPKLLAAQVKAMEKLTNRVEGHYTFFKEQLADQSAYCIEQYTRIFARFDWLEEQLGFQFSDGELCTRISRT